MDSQPSAGPDIDEMDDAAIGNAMSVFDLVGHCLDQAVAVERAARELVHLTDRLVERAVEAPRVTQKEADRVETALANLRYEIERLQERANPPPRSPISSPSGSSEMTPLDRWLIPYRFDGLPGPPHDHDWDTIATLLALYELLFGRQASGSTSRHVGARPHPTMRFLTGTFALANARARARLGTDLQLEAPPAETLRATLKRLRSRVEYRKSGLRDAIILTD